ncbi:MAG TPA: VOC family protein [Anaerolineales bacterium]|nr:VOC family protein [Anaerolineales bacterium]
MITQLTQVSIAVQDVARAVAFYRDVLKLPYLFSIPNAAFFQLGSTRLYLVLAPPNSGFTHSSVFYYQVADLSACYAELMAQGVTSVDAPHWVAKMPTYDLWMAFLKDSEGNTFALLEEKSLE